MFISKKDFDALCERVQKLNDFYETPKETANSDLERKVDELNKKLEEAETARAEDLRRQEEYERSMQRQFENMLAYDGSDQTARGDE